MKKSFITSGPDQPNHRLSLIRYFTDRWAQAHFFAHIYMSYFYFYFVEQGKLYLILFLSQLEILSYKIATWTRLMMILSTYNFHSVVKQKTKNGINLWVCLSQISALILNTT